MTKFSHIVKACAAGIAATALVVGSATAHTSYLLPNIFTANVERYVTLQASFAEDFFRPEIAVDNADFHVIRPDGSRAELENITKLRQMVVLESPIEEEGTYRFTTGVRHGRTGQVALVDGEWVPVRGEAPASAVQVQTSQTETVADVYVTKKAPTRAPVDLAIGRLVIQPVTHPSDIYKGGGFDFKILFDGEPLADQVVNLDRGDAQYDAAPAHRELRTDAQGGVSLSFEKPGVYLLMVRHRAAAPAGSETDQRSYTTSLTFEVQPY
ncbi:DUF4198 domain-containing protein [Stakelama tenebrarum]|uniref:DUF4198 domain-containing protein n=1 Tax=Stakelama tenebrarum TaxID=2711215 RepID=A0A6G6Y1S0_9SPHN|nr:DUF4198 domain-containing protein [Sphingosinithalassobacter tenebrarum]QIG78757.1 DUF4198 domain-containing protein [Sphingosinithalassobacter tenebrarum]